MKSSTAVMPHLIPRAALMRRRALQLGGINDYSTPSTSTPSLTAAVPEATNMYVLAYGEKEGLAPGERLEAYGPLVRLIYTTAYGPSRFVSGAEDPQLAEITRQLNKVSALYEELQKATTTTTTTTTTMMNPTMAAGSSGTANGRGTTKKQTTSAAPSATSSSSLSANATEADLWRLVCSTPPPSPPTTRSNRGEVVIAEWRQGARSSPSSPVRPPASSSGAPSAAHYAAKEAENQDDLLVENGVCFSSPESAGLRVLRAARLAFIYSIESTANGVVERQRRQQRSEEHRPLAILDVSELDFTFSQAAVQSTVELGLHGESQCHMTFVPLTDAAAQAALNPLASFVRQAVEVPGKALRDPFELVPLRYFDVGAYTAYLDLTTALPTSSATSTPHTRRNDSVSGISARAALALRGGLRRPHDPAAPLARALGTMRKGAAMLVTFMPTPDSRAAVYKELQRQHHPRAEVEMETRAVDAAKMVIAEAISRTGRWSSITDEVLPSVDCPQGSALSLTVVME